MMKYILAGIAAVIVVGVAVLKSDLACQYSPVNIAWINECKTNSPLEATTNIITITPEQTLAGDDETDTQANENAGSATAEMEQTTTDVANIDQTTSGETLATAEKAAEAAQAVVQEQLVQTPPTFDLARVETDGSTLVAGRGAPNSTIILKNADKVIGEATVNAAGEWVIVVDEPLTGASASLSLIGLLPDGQRIVSEETLSIALQKEQAAEQNVQIAAVEPETVAEAVENTISVVKNETNATTTENTVVENAVEEDVAAADSVAQEIEQVAEQTVEVADELAEQPISIAQEIAKTAEQEVQKPVEIVEEVAKTTENAVETVAKVVEEVAVQDVKIAAVKPIVKTNDAPTNDTPLVVLSKKGEASRVLQGAGVGSENSI